MGLKTRLKDEKNLPPLSFQIARDRISRILWNNKVCFLRPRWNYSTDRFIHPMKRRRKGSSRFSTFLRVPDTTRKKKEKRTKNRSRNRQIKYSGEIFSSKRNEFLEKSGRIIEAKTRACHHRGRLMNILKRPIESRVIAAT